MGISTDNTDRKIQKYLPRIYADERGFGGKVRMIGRSKAETIRQSRHPSKKMGGIAAAQPLEGGEKEILL